MAYPSHYLLQFGGSRGVGENENWSCGIRMITVPVGQAYEPGDVKDYLDDVCVPALSSWFGRNESRISQTCHLDFAKLNRIGADGKYADELTVEHFLATDVVGATSGTNTVAMVLQASLVLTWETDTVSRGLASRGRIYSPAPAIPVNEGTGLFSTGTALEIATSAAQLISDLRGSGGAGAMTPNIVSDGGAGVAHRIDSVSVDNRVDIIRKRANSLSPVRSKIAVPA